MASSYRLVILLPWPRPSWIWQPIRSSARRWVSEAASGWSTTSTPSREPSPCSSSIDDSFANAAADDSKTGADMTDALVTGPVVGGSHGWAFGASVRELGEVGYVEGEWFVEGDAATYDFAPGTEAAHDGRWNT